VRLARRASLCVTLLLVSGCGGAAAPTTTGAPVEATTTTAGSGATTSLAPSPGSPGPGDGGCVITVTGDDERSWSAPDHGEGFATDHWRSEDELRAQHELLAIQDDPTFEEVQQAGLAVFSFFSVACVSTEGETVAIFVSDATTRDHMPMAPGTYPISGGLYGAGELPAAEMSASYVPATGTMWGEVGEGTVSIDVWDASRIRGTFTFVAEERFVADPRVVEVAGTFEFETGE
jgi:hypothetical protein